MPLAFHASGKSLRPPGIAEQLLQDLGRRWHRDPPGARPLRAHRRRCTWVRECSAQEALRNTKAVKRLLRVRACGGSAALYMVFRSPHCPRGGRRASANAYVASSANAHVASSDPRGLERLRVYLCVCVTGKKNTMGHCAGAFQHENGGAVSAGARRLGGLSVVHSVRCGRWQAPLGSCAEVRSRERGVRCSAQPLDGDHGSKSHTKRLLWSIGKESGCIVPVTASCGGGWRRLGAEDHVDAVSSCGFVLRAYRFAPESKCMS